MAEILADDGEPIGMRAVAERAQGVVHVAVGAVEACLLEFLDHHVALHFEASFAECEAKHAVALDS